MMNRRVASSRVVDRFRLSDRWELLLDAIGVFVVLSYLWTFTGSGSATGLVLVLAGWVAAMCRRIWPVASVMTTLALSAATMFTGQPDALYVWCFAQLSLFSFALHRGVRDTVLAASSLAVVLYGGSILRLDVGVLEPTSVGLIAWTAAAAGLGSAIRLQREFVKGLAERAALMSASQEKEIDQRITRERLRIAADLHDVLAHHMAVISVNAGSAEAQLPDGAVHAAASLRSIRTAVGGALNELQSIVGFLREPNADGVSSDRSPAPGAERVPELVESFRRIGAVVDVEWPNGDAPTRLTTAGDLACYRVIQEALTNAHKHGEGPVTVSAAENDDSMTIIVRNALRKQPVPAPGSGGFGLVGMRERVAWAGGTVRVTDDGRVFSLAVSLPLSTTDPEEESQ